MLQDHVIVSPPPQLVVLFIMLPISYITVFSTAPVVPKVEVVKDVTTGKTEVITEKVVEDETTGKTEVVKEVKGETINLILA